MRVRGDQVSGNEPFRESIQLLFEPYNVQVIPDAGDIKSVGADTIAKLSAQTSEGQSFAAWDQRPVIMPALLNYQSSQTF